MIKQSIKQQTAGQQHPGCGGFPPPKSGAKKANDEPNSIWLGTAGQKVDTPRDIEHPVERSLKGQSSSVGVVFQEGTRNAEDSLRQ
jgi:hypothetical protein